MKNSEWTYDYFDEAKALDNFFFDCPYVKCVRFCILLFLLLDPYCVLADHCMMVGGR